MVHPTQRSVKINKEFLAYELFCLFLLYTYDSKNNIPAKVLNDKIFTII